MRKIIIILTVLLLIASIKWWSYFIGMAALLHYMEQKGLRFPSDAEINQCREWALKHWVDDIFKQ